MQGHLPSVVDRRSLGGWGQRGNCSLPQQFLGESGLTGSGGQSPQESTWGSAGRDLGPRIVDS